MIRQRPFVSCRAVVLAISPVLGLASVSQAWLGGFENADGYQSFLNMVQNYNAGQYGPNGGYGGSAAAIPPNSGLWTAVSGGFFTGSAVSYSTGHQNLDRQWINNGTGAASNQALVCTTGHEGWTASPLKYRYNFDAADFSGMTPASTGNANIKVSFWVWGQIHGLGTPPSDQIPEGYYGNAIEFHDAGGNVGFSLGLTQRAAGDKVTYWNGSSMFESAIIPSPGLFDRWDLEFDMATDTVSASYYHFQTNNTFNLVTGMPMMNAMSALTNMTIRTSPGENNAKIFAIDDFSFQVRDIPAPASALMVGIGGLLATRRRRA